MYLHGSLNYRQVLVYLSFVLQREITGFNAELNRQAQRKELGNIGKCHSNLNYVFVSKQSLFNNTFEHMFYDGYTSC